MAETPIRGERILRVDDEELVRASLCMMLEPDSYLVNQAQVRIKHATNTVRAGSIWISLAGID